MNRLLLSVDPDLDMAPFQQIADQLREFLERGDLRQATRYLKLIPRLISSLKVVGMRNTDMRAFFTPKVRRGTTRDLEMV